MAGNAADFKVGGDAREAVSALQSLMRHQAKVVDMFGAMGRASGKAKKKTSGAFGKRAAGDLKKYAIGLGSVGVALAGVRKLLASLNAERKEAAGRVKGSEGDARNLAQLAGGDDKKYKRLLGGVVSSRVTEGMDPAVAARLQFQLSSLNYNKEKQRMTAASLARITSSPDAPVDLVRGVSKMQSAFGKSETGGLRNVMNKFLVASKTSDVSMTQLAAPAATAAPLVKELGGGDEEFLASLAVTSKGQKGPEGAAIIIQALAKVMLQKGHAGKGLIGGVKEMQKKYGKLSEKQLIKEFGRVEAAKGFLAVRQNMAEIERMTADLHEADRQTGKGGDAIRNAIDTQARNNPMLESARKTRVAKQRLQVTQESLLAKDQLDRDAAVDKVKLRDYGQGLNVVSRVVSGWKAEAENYLGVDSDTISGIPKDTAPKLAPEVHSTPGYRVEVKITPDQDTSNSQTE